MCGICGMACRDTSQTPSGSILAEMNQTLQHRGVDQEGLYVAGGIGLAIQRLAIVDPESGNQPIKNEDGKIVLVCNGEIYNAPELRRKLSDAGHYFKTGSDVEVIVHLYEQYGTDCVKHLRGMFAFGLWDEVKKRLMLARDRFGIKPLFYTQLPTGLYFSSEQKALLTVPGLSHSVNESAVYDLFTFGFVVSPNCMIKSIKRLPPAHFLLFEKNNVHSDCYWKLDLLPQRQPQFTHKELPQLIREKLKEAVEIHTRSDVPVAAWLSGGIDSSVIVAYMLKHCKHPIDVFSLSYQDTSVDEFKGQRTLGDYQGFDFRVNKIVCRDSDFNLFPRALWHCEDPFTGAAEISRFILARASANHYKVVLTGEGADEVFAGYHWYAGEKRLRLFNVLPQFLRHMIAETPCLKNRYPGASQILKGPKEMGFERFSRLIGPTGNRDILTKVFSDDLLSMRHSHDRSYLFSNYNSSLVTLQHLDLNIRLSDCVVQHLDRMTMACSLEARVPFLDHELVELAAQIPVAHRYRIGREKWLLRQAVKDEIPDEIRLRKKYSMTTPFQNWLRSELPDFAKFMFSRLQIERKGYFNFDTVKWLLDNHRSGHGSFGRTLLAILGMQVWDELFIQKKSLE